MIKIGEFADEKLGNKLVLALNKKSIKASISYNIQNEMFILEVYEEKDIPLALEMLRVALGLPGVPPEIDPDWKKIKSVPFGNITKLLTYSCVGLFIITNFFDKDKSVMNLLLFEQGGVSFHNGEFWRLISPAFLHFGLLHIIFNMMWFKDLGSIIEKTKGSAYLLLLIFIFASASNYIQYFLHGPRFGGMSGVVFAFLGYLWIHKLVHPDFPYRIPKKDTYFIFGWYLLCLSGLVGPIANMAHGVGLFLGLIFGLYPFRTIHNFKKGFASILVGLMLLFVTFYVEK